MKAFTTEDAKDAESPSVEPSNRASHDESVERRTMRP